MFARKTTALALGTLLALAVTLSGSVAPAFAAVAPSVPARDRMEHLGEVFHPDVRVKYLGPAYDNGKYQYRFRVENIGAASADNVFVDQEVRQLTYDGSIGKIQYLGGKNIPTLASGQSVEVKVSCIPLPGYVCTGASATANVPDDLDPTNNDAQST